METISFFPLSFISSINLKIVLNKLILKDMLKQNEKRFLLKDLRKRTQSTTWHGGIENWNIKKERLAWRKLILENVQLFS